MYWKMNESIKRNSIEKSFRLFRTLGLGNNTRFYELLFQVHILHKLIPVQIIFFQIKCWIDLEKQQDDIAE